MKKFCDNCGNEIKENQSFCDKCGKKVETDISENNLNKKGNIINKKTIIIAISVLVLLVIGFVIKGNIDEKNKIQELKQSTQEYKDKAFTFSFEVLSSLADIESVGNDVKTYWYDYIYNDKYSSIDDAVDKALEDNKDKVTTIKNNKETIEKDYKFLLKVPDESNSELLEIQKAVKDLYNDYYDFYDVVITPTGNYNSFTSDFSSLDSSGVKKYNYLNSLLGY